MSSQIIQSHDSEAITTEKISAVTTPFQDHVAEHERLDQSFVVDFGGELDPSNPKNWSSRQKWKLVMIVSTLDFAV